MPQAPAPAAVCRSPYRMHAGTMHFPQRTLYFPRRQDPPENTKGAGGIASVSAFAFDGTSIDRLCTSVKGPLKVLRFSQRRCPLHCKSLANAFCRYSFSPASSPLALAGRWPPSISQCSSRLIMARSAKVAASGTTDSRFCRQEGLSDLGRHQKFQRGGQAAAHFMMEVVVVVEKGRPHIVVAGFGQAGDDDEQADHFGQTCDHGTAVSRKPSRK